MAQEYRVLLIEADTAVSRNIEAVIRETVGFQLAATYASLHDALTQGEIFSPNLILVDVDPMEEYSGIEQIRRQFPDVRVLGLGKKWSLVLFRAIIRAGADGFLVAPFSSMELINSVGTFKETATRSKVIAFFSPKGKSGKTTFIANLAVALAKDSQERVGILDADLQFGDMALFFDLHPQSTITEAIRDIGSLSPTTLHSYFVPISSKVSVLCGTRTPELSEQVLPADFTTLVQMSRSLFSYVFIDLPAAFGPIANAACETADETVIMTMINGGFELQHVKRCLSVFRGWSDDEKRLQVVASRVEPCTDDMKQYIADQLDYPVYAIVPNEYMLVSTAANNGRIVSDIRSDSAFAKAVAAIAKKMHVADRKR